MFMNRTIHDSKFRLSDTRYDSRFNYHMMKKNMWSVMWLAQSMILKPLNQLHNSESVFPTC